MDKIDEGLGRMMGDALRGVTNSKEKKGRKGTKSYKVGNAVRQFARGISGKESDAGAKKKRLSKKIKKRVGKMTPSAHGVGSGLRRMTKDSIKGVRKAGKGVSDFKRGAFKQKAKDKKPSKAHKAGRGTRNFVRGVAGKRDDSRGAVKGNSKAHAVGSKVRTKVGSGAKKTKEAGKKVGSKLSSTAKEAKDRIHKFKSRMEPKKKSSSSMGKQIRSSAREGIRKVGKKLSDAKKRMSEPKPLSKRQAAKVFARRDKKKADLADRSRRGKVAASREGAQQRVRRKKALDRIKARKAAKPKKRMKWTSKGGLQAVD